KPADREIPEPRPACLTLSAIADDVDARPVGGPAPLRVGREQSHARLNAANDLAVVAAYVLLETEARTAEERRERNGDGRRRDCDRECKLHPICPPGAACRAYGPGPSHFNARR